MLPLKRRLPSPGIPQLSRSFPHWVQQLGTSVRGPRPSLEALLLSSCLHLWNFGFQEVDGPHQVLAQLQELYCE